MPMVRVASYNFGFIDHTISEIVKFEEYTEQYEGQITGKYISLWFFDKEGRRHTIRFDSNRKLENYIVIGKKSYNYHEMIGNLPKFRMRLEKEILKDAIEALP